MSQTSVRKVPNYFWSKYANNAHAKASSDSMGLLGENTGYDPGGVLKAQERSRCGTNFPNLPLCQR